MKGKLFVLFALMMNLSTAFADYGNHPPPPPPAVGPGNGPSYCEINGRWRTGEVCERQACHGGVFRNGSCDIPSIWIGGGFYSSRYPIRRRH